MTTYDSQFQQLNRKDRLGPQDGTPLQTSSPPLKFYSGSILCVAISVILLTIYGFLSLRPEPLAEGTSLLLWFGIPFGIIGVSILMKRSFRSSVLQAHKEGFTVKRGTKEEIVLFDEVDGFTFFENEKLSNGVPIGVERKLSIHSPHVSTLLNHISLSAQPDNFGPFSYWILGRLADTAEKKIKNGEALRGQGWTFDTAGLHSGKNLPVTLPEIVEVAIFDKKVSLWRQNEDLPFFTVDANSKDARLLFEIVRRGLPEDSGVRKPSDSFGRLLFRKKSSTSAIVFMAVFTLFALGIGGWLLFWGTGEERFYGGLWFAGGLILLWYTVFKQTRVWQFHELGVTERSPLNTKSLKYAAVERMKYQATRHYHNGVYSGTSVGFSLFPGEGAVPLKFNGKFRGTDQDLEHVREFISALVAEKLYKRLSGESSVAWGRSVSLSKKGVHYTHNPLFGKKEPRDALFAEDLRFKIEEGIFSLFRSDEKKALMTMPCSEENFYPGFILMSRLASEAQDKK